MDAPATAAYIRAVLEGQLPLAEPIARQVDHLVRACKAIEAAADSPSLQRLSA